MLDNKEIEIEMKINLEDMEVTFSCGYDTTCTYCNVLNIKDIKEALEDYIKTHNLIIDN